MKQSTLPAGMLSGKPFAASSVIVTTALLAGCEPGRFGSGGGGGVDGLHVLLLVLAVGLAMLALTIFVIVRNFVAPKTWSVVVGLVLGVLSLPGFIQSLLQGAFAAVGMSGLITALLLWSAIYGWRKIKAN